MSGQAHDAAGGLAPEPFPWAEAMAFGLGVLRLAPDQFWRMTPRELAVIAGALTRRQAPIERATFATLMTRYPDVGNR